MPPRQLRLLVLALPLVTLAACGHDPEPVTRPAPRTTEATSARSVVALRGGWGATVLLQRADSLVLTLPDGSSQLQRVGRTARFTVDVGSNNTFSATLDAI